MYNFNRAAPDRARTPQARRTTSSAAARWSILGFFLVAVSGILLRPLLPIDETRYLAVAWEMWQSHDWLVPTRNFALYTHKPPLLFWTINLVWAVTGVSEFAARLVGPLYAVLTLLMTGALARYLWPDDPDVGARATIALVGTTVFALFGGLTMFDAMLSAATVGGLLALVHGIDTGAWRWWATLGAAIAAGVLAKGPVILLHLGPAILLAPVWARGRAELPLRRTLFGGGLAIAVALAIVGLWLVPAIVTGGPAYRDAILWTQSAGRIGGSFGHARPWWFVPALLPVLCFPWILVAALWRAARSTSWREAGLRLTLVWTLSALVLFSVISGKQPHYLIPELPGLALIVARLSRDHPQFRLTGAVLPLGFVALAGVAAAAGLVPLGELAQDVQPRSMLLAWAFLLLAVCWLGLRLGGLRGGAVLTLFGLASLNLLIASTDIDSGYDTHRIAGAIEPFSAEGIAFYGQPYHAEFNFAARLTEPVATPETVAALTDWQASHPDGVVVARPDRAALPWEAHATIRFRNSDYAVWHVADLPHRLD